MARKLAATDVVVLLPGILGSVLQRDGEDVWAISKGAAWRGLLSLGRSVKDLRVEQDNPTAPQLDDGVIATRLMPDVHLLPGFWKIDGYTKIKEVLHQRFDFVDGKNWFDFPYDWRRDNRAAAHRLAEEAPRWLENWRRESGQSEASLVLVGHSMGGLVARYFLEALGGWEHSRALVTFGTPYRGSLNALDFAVNGFVKGFGPFKIDLSDLLRSLNSVYQLMPTYPCIEDGSGSLRKIVDIEGLPGVDPTKASDATTFHNEISEAVDRNGGYGRYDIHPMVGIFQPTRQSATFRNGVVTILSTYEGDDHGGDGTVPRVSATPLELSDNPRESYATQAHATLQNVDGVLVQLMGVLSRQSLARFRSTPFDGFRLEVDDVVSPGAPIDVTIEAGGPVASVAARVTDVDTGASSELAADLDADGRAVITFPPQPAGIYRVTVSDGAEEPMARPVSDLIVVGDDEVAEREVQP